MALAARYGIFRDEMYYVACGKHLAFGYVDHPPLVAVMARVSTALFGDSVRALRVLPALCAAAMVLLGAELARTMKGGSFAQLLAATCIAIAPEFLGTCHFLSMNCALPVCWTAAAIFAARAVTLHGPASPGANREWLAFGVACGLGLLAKHSTLAFGAALAVGLLATPQRKVLGTAGPWIGLGVAALLLAPNLVWEKVHGWPTLEFMHNAATKKMVRMPPLSFIGAEVLDMLPQTLPVWLAGTAWLLASERGRPVRFLGIAFVVVFAVILVGNGKPYYLAPAFPVAYAGGAVAIEGWLKRRAWRGVVMGLLLAGGLAAAPLALPVLPELAFVKYAAAMGVSQAEDEKHEKGLLPQFQADQHGWEAMASKVAAAYAALTPEEQRVTTLYGGNYGEAGALDYFGKRWGLPPAVSGHNAYFMWGPPTGGRGDVMIAVGDFSCADWDNVYASVAKVDETDDPYVMPYENHVPICVLRGPKVPLEQVWPRLRHYI
jgi:hypothetical protein